MKNKYIVTIHSDQGIDRVEFDTWTHNELLRSIEEWAASKGIEEIYEKKIKMVR